MKEWQNEKKTLETAASCPVTQLHNQMCARTSDNNNPSSKPAVSPRSAVVEVVAMFRYVYNYYYNTCITDYKLT